jgi:hypothetical protein
MTAIGCATGAIGGGPARTAGSAAPDASSSGRPAAHAWHREPAVRGRAIVYQDSKRRRVQAGQRGCIHSMPGSQSPSESQLN